MAALNVWIDYLFWTQDNNGKQAEGWTTDAQHTAGSHLQTPAHCMQLSKCLFVNDQNRFCAEAKVP